MSQPVPQVIATLQVVAPASSPSTTGTTPSTMVVASGNSVYVFISFGGNTTGTLQVSSVVDSQGRSYTRAGRVTENLSSPYPCQEIWYADSLTASSTFSVTVTFSSSTLFVITAVQISGADPSGSLDVVSAGTGAIGTTTSDPVTATRESDLVLSCAGIKRGFSSPNTASGVPGPFTSLYLTYSGAGTNDLASNCWYFNGTLPQTYNSKLSWTTNEPFSILTVAIRPVALWANLSGKPFFTVSPTGISGGSSTIANDGADFGPDTPSTTTCGIQEALNSAAPLGLGVRLIAKGVFTVSGQIIVPGNVRLFSDMFGGEKYSAIRVPSPSKIHYTGSSGYAILVGNNSDSSGTILEGLTIDGTAANALIRVQGTRDLRIINCYVDNGSTASTAYAIECDGGSDNTEHCLVEKSQFFANSAGGAIGIGINDAGMHCNDWTWYFVTAENYGTGPVVDGQFGGNHQFFNFYSRQGNASAILSGAASIKLIGGELLNNNSAGNIATISGGDWIFRDLTMTQGKITATGGTVSFHRVKVNAGIGAFTFNGASVFIDRYCDLTNLGTGNLIIGGNSTDLYLDTRNPLWDIASELSVSGSGRVHPSDPTNPPSPGSISSAAWPYTNNVSNLRCVVITGGSFVTVKLNGTAVASSALSVPIACTLVLRYKDQISISLGSGGANPTGSFYDIT